MPHLLADGCRLVDRWRHGLRLTDTSCPTSRSQSSQRPVAKGTTTMQRRYHRPVLPIYFLYKGIISFKPEALGMNDDDTPGGPLEEYLDAEFPERDPTTRPPSNRTPPKLDTSFEDESARERLYSVLVQTREPQDASAIAGQAGCHPDTARKYLDWFAQLGLAVEHEGRPATFERNEAYFEWRYVTELAAHHTLDELRQHSQSILERLETYRDEYGADGPSLVDAREVADETRELDEVWADLATWATLEDELRFHERGRQLLMERPDVEAVRS